MRSRLFTSMMLTSVLQLVPRASGAAETVQSGGGEVTAANTPLVELRDPPNVRTHAEIGALVDRGAKLTKDGATVSIVRVKGAASLQDVLRYSEFNASGVIFATEDGKNLLVGRDADGKLVTQEHTNWATGRRAVTFAATARVLYAFVAEGQKSALNILDRKEGVFVDVATYATGNINGAGKAVTVDAKVFMNTLRGSGVIDAVSLGREQRFVDARFGVYLSKDGKIVNCRQFGNFYRDDGTVVRCLITRKYNVAQDKAGIYIGLNLDLIDVPTLLSDPSKVAIVRDILANKGIAAATLIVVGSTLKNQGKVANVPADILDAFNLTPAQIPSNFSFQQLLPLASRAAAAAQPVGGEETAANAPSVELRDLNDDTVRRGNFYLDDGTVVRCFITKKYNVAQDEAGIYIGLNLDLIDVPTLLSDPSKVAIVRDILANKGIAATALIVVGSTLKNQGKLANVPADILDAFNLTPAQIPSNFNIEQLVRTSGATPGP